MSYQTYSLILSLVIFVMLVSVSVLVIAIIYKQKLKLITSGTEDNSIFAEYEEESKKETNIITKVLSIGLTLLFLLLFVTAFCVSAYVNLSQNKIPNGVPVFQVVKTDSMAKKHEKNSYLVENNLNTQFRSMDLIITHKLPAEQDLKLYDVVVYEVDSILLVHRIVRIDPPSVSHPNEYYFLLQGDNVESPDRFPVLYSQMKGIYYGERLPFVGSFVLFLQSPVGWLCLLLVVIAIVVTPILEKRLQREKLGRIELLLGTTSVSDLTKDQLDELEDCLDNIVSKTYNSQNTLYNRLTDIINPYEAKDFVTEEPKPKKSIFTKFKEKIAAGGGEK